MQLLTFSPKNNLWNKCSPYHHTHHESLSTLCRKSQTTSEWLKNAPKTTARTPNLSSAKLHFGTIFTPVRTSPDITGGLSRAPPTPKKRNSRHFFCLLTCTACIPPKYTLLCFPCISPNLAHFFPVLKACHVKHLYWTSMTCVPRKHNYASII